MKIILFDSNTSITEIFAIIHGTMFLYVYLTDYANDTLLHISCSICEIRILNQDTTNKYCDILLSIQAKQQGTQEL